MKGHLTFPGRMSFPYPSQLRMRQIPSFLFALLFLLFFLLLEGPMFYIPYYHEQHHLFLFTRTYLESHLCYPGQLLNYLTDFCIQFFHLSHIGKFVFALLLSLPYLLNTLICKRLTKKQDLFMLSLLPSLYLLIRHLSIDFPLTHVVGLNICLLLFYLVSLPESGKWRYPLFLIITGTLCFICGWRYPAMALICICIPLLSAVLANRYILKLQIRWVILFISILVYSVGTFYYFIFSYNMRERLIIEAEMHVKAGEWEKVLNCCQRYRGNNQLVRYFNNMALYHTGRLPYDLFETPQTMGVQSLYLPWKSDSRQSEYGHYLYEQLGYINEAHRWEFEAMVVFGETAPHLINLIRYNIVNHRPKVAMRFIRTLKQSLFYREQAAELEKYVSSGEIAGLKALTYDKNENIRFVNVFNIAPELSYLCDKDSTNRMAFEYLMSDLLLSNRLVRFAENLRKMHSFSYPQLPRIYEEALYVYRLGVDEETFNSSGFTIRPETEERFKTYYSHLQKGNRKELQQKFGNTYWYYLNYISPYGNKIINK